MPDPATETDRELLDRLLPGWRIVPTHSGVYVFSTIFRSHEFVTESMAVSNAASSLRAILARDRETMGEAAKAESATATPTKLRRWPVLTVFIGKEDWITANDGTIWRHGDAAIGEQCWVRAPNLPQPGEDGGE